MRINHNIAALNTHRQLTSASQAQSKSMEKLSSGLRINRAGDDAAGLAISEKMRGQIRGLEMGSKNAQDGISLIQTAEGALNETHSILQRMRELAVQSSNDTNTDTDRSELQKEVDQLVQEIDRIANTTEFNTKKLINGNLSGVNNSAQSTKFDEVSDSAVFTGITNGATITADTTYNVEISGANATGTTFTVTYTQQDGTAGSVKVGTAGGTVTIGQSRVTIAALGTEDIGKESTFTQRKAVTDNSDTSLTYQIGANSSQTMKVSIENMSASALKVNNIKVTSSAASEASISAINKAIEDVSAQRSKLGAFQNRLEHTINNLGTSAENLTAAESRVRDVDMAKEMMESTKNGILSQAAQAMLAQANQQPQGVLQLLR
ncbi:flagellin N-terminal helical domain-containing protein [Metabacillus halosaccharovorans]|uniref:Flagellin n=1 Tax=Metabacillus halosaccharovorans TaxID=930124 RepID=A0ABT3DC92_9BACI|nr:flagellin [Metabacillus halosaccharovorans]MCV9884675.1 flagellin [Metabacillus halosaccharovorans]